MGLPYASPEWTGRQAFSTSKWKFAIIGVEGRVFLNWIRGMGVKGPEDVSRLTPRWRKPWRSRVQEV
jgi:hypothetical protein